MRVHKIRLLAFAPPESAEFQEEPEEVEAASWHRRSAAGERLPARKSARPMEHR